MKPLQYKSYLGSIECNLDEGCLHGKVLHINDLVTYESKTVSGLDAAFKGAVDDYLETCTQLGKVPDKAFKGTFNVRMTPELHKAAALEAALAETTLNDFVSQAVAEKLAGQGPHQHKEQHIHIETHMTEPIDFGELCRWDSFFVKEDPNEYKA